MRIDGQKRSDNFEDRGVGAGGARGAGGIPVGLLLAIAQRLGLKGTAIVVAMAGLGYLFLPAELRQLLLGPVAGEAPGQAAQVSTGQGACDLSVENQKSCDFSRVVLASTEKVWREKFLSASLPDYGQGPTVYQDPTLVVFAQAVTTGGCGPATSGVGPFYCPADQKLYIDPSFYHTLEKRLKAPGDFAQAYVIAHEVGHHVQNLLGSPRLSTPRETKNQISVRVELQADCLAGVWGHTARADLDINESDLQEALGAAHSIGDDSLGHADASQYTHGTSAQRVRWFRVGFESGDPRRCDTFSSPPHKL